MELAAQSPGMVRELADLDVNRVGGLAGQVQAVLRQNRLELAVELIAVAVPFADLRRAIRGTRETAFREIARVRSQTHGAAQFVDAFQLAQFIDDAIRRSWIDLGRVGLLHS